MHAHNDGPVCRFSSWTCPRTRTQCRAGASSIKEQEYVEKCFSKIWSNQLLWINYSKLVSTTVCATMPARPSPKLWHDVLPCGCTTPSQSDYYINRPGFVAATYELYTSCGFCSKATLQNRFRASGGVDDGIEFIGGSCHLAQEAETSRSIFFIAFCSAKVAIGILGETDAHLSTKTRSPVLH